MRISAKQYAAAWHEALMSADRAQWDAVSDRFLKYIHEQGSLKLLPDIVRRIEDLEHTQSGVTAVTVRGAHPIEPTEAKRIAADVLGTEHLSVSVETDPDLIGGVSIETNNTRWNFTLAQQLNALAKRIKE